MNNSMKEAEDYINQIPLFGPHTEGRNKSGNENLEAVMALLGNPHLAHKAIHVAGTNGKGSTVQFLRAILTEEGYRVRTFTSPHLISITERIEGITEEEFVECYQIVRNACEHAVQKNLQHLSYFEFLFAMAAVYFSKLELDYVIYETGLGGRLDATNVLVPVLTIITEIGLDHMKYLGNTIEAIAGEKAGIIKTGVPVVYHTGSLEADAVVKNQAEALAAEAINVANVEYNIDEFTDKTIDFSMYSRYYSYNGLRLDSVATYQVDNAVTAITAGMVLLGRQIAQEKIQLALDAFFWPGRMEKLNGNIVIDGAHNESAIERFTESVNAGYADREKTLLFAVAGDKDYEPMIAYLMQNLEVEAVYVTSLDSDRAISAEYIAALFRDCAKKTERNVHVYADNDIRSCFAEAYAAVEARGGMLFCVGSLYLIGKIKDIWEETV
ncbi:MAG: bifunctional folylpolyglutamate synthase/dihydrofolate synthase [Coprococcus sp.]|nr:Mur ligase family protein [Lachnospiraceae bacterium]